MEHPPKRLAKQGILSRARSGGDEASPLARSTEPTSTMAGSLAVQAGCRQVNRPIEWPRGAGRRRHPWADRYLLSASPHRPRTA